MSAWILDYICSAHIPGRFGKKSVRWLEKGEEPTCNIKLMDAAFREFPPYIIPKRFECQDCGVQITRDRRGGFNRRYPIIKHGKLPYQDFKPKESNNVQTNDS